jgi:hypothetical protein
MSRNAIHGFSTNTPLPFNPPGFPASNVSLSTPHSHVLPWHARTRNDDLFLRWWRGFLNILVFRAGRQPLLDIAPPLETILNSFHWGSEHYKRSWSSPTFSDMCRLFNILFSLSQPQPHAAGYSPLAGKLTTSRSFEPCKSVRFTVIGFNPSKFQRSALTRTNHFYRSPLSHHSMLTSHIYKA